MDSNTELNAERQIGVADTELVVFRESPIHGLGGFARRAIPTGTRIFEYVGERIGKGESLRRCEQNNPFIFTLTDEEDLDGDVPWNPARLLNHSCEPNCEAELEGDRIWIIAKRDIAAGEEITFNYGYDLVDYRDYPCQCGSPNCVGYMVAEEFFEHVLSRQAGREEACGAKSTREDADSRET
jgi:SET domain-containing protein